MKLSNDEFLRIVGFIKENFGVDLTKKRTLIEGRLLNTIIKRGYKDYHSYLNMVISDKTGLEVSRLIDVLTTNHTYFMRETEHFDYFESTVLPNFERNLREKDFRLWSAGCSTGQEPYTLAMILDRFFSGTNDIWNKELLATDISVNVLNKATAGIYSKEEISELPSYFKVEYFQSISKQSFQVKDSLKKEVIFRPFNLMEIQFPFKRKFHVIFCRNVMIYFDDDTKNNLLWKFYDSLEEGGYLFIGHSESVDRSVIPFQYVRPSVYRKVCR